MAFCTLCFVCAGIWHRYLCGVQRQHSQLIPYLVPLPVPLHLLFWKPASHHRSCVDHAVQLWHAGRFCCRSRPAKSGKQTVSGSGRVRIAMIHMVSPTAFFVLRLVERQFPFRTTSSLECIGPIQHRLPNSGGILALNPVSYRDLMGKGGGHEQRSRLLGTYPPPSASKTGILRISETSRFTY